ncbi:hypothetical protein [Neisseria chenwenguii]|uniref:hypothetical protein n=1 Tax=Neisseria chenwenguii TaxID=1853278 RepID=UPI000F51238D|nr:hypothetical protein [Neisseria chenwenguii]
MKLYRKLANLLKNNRQSCALPAVLSPKIPFQANLSTFANSSRCSLSRAKKSDSRLKNKADLSCPQPNRLLDIKIFLLFKFSFYKDYFFRRPANSLQTAKRKGVKQSQIG